MSERPQRTSRLLLLLLLTGSSALWSQSRELQPPPNYTQGAVTTASEEVIAAWKKWQTATNGLEQRILRLPMAEARQSAEAGLAAYLEFLDRRKAYSSRVLEYIDKSRIAPSARQVTVSTTIVYQDQLQVLGVNLETLQAKLDTLRESAEWVPIRRKVQAASAQVLKLQSTLRAEMPMDYSLGPKRDAPSISALVYGDMEREIGESLTNLWTSYYFALLESFAQSPGRPAQVSGGRPGAGSTGGSAKTAGAQAPTESPLIGAWTYVEGSQAFNGVAEPGRALLEIWLDNGALAGRYRADLPDFEGMKQIDLRLHRGNPSGRDQQTFDFESLNPPATGRIILEGPGADGMQLMLVRIVSAQGVIPRGRELLRRR